MINTMPVATARTAVPNRGAPRQCFLIEKSTHRPRRRLEPRLRLAGRVGNPRSGRRLELESRDGLDLVDDRERPRTPLPTEPNRTPACAIACYEIVPQPRRRLLFQTPTPNLDLGLLPFLT